MTKPAQPIRLYRNALSGHAHRAELMLSLLGLPFEKIDVDLTKGAQKSPDFLAKNPFGQVPVIEDGGLTIADSNAILVYLATRYDESGRWLPRDPANAARVQQWLSVAAGQLAFGPALARVIRVFGRKFDPAMPLAIAAQLYGIVEAHLSRSPFLVGDHPTIADVAMYSYTACAPEGGISLQPYPNILAWLTRIEALPGFMAIPRANVPDAAVA
jgi:glutathione S-transferase